MRVLLVVALSLLAAPGNAQDALPQPPFGGDLGFLPDVQAGSIRAAEARGAILKGLDKVSGDVTDIELAVGESVALGRIEVTLSACRYPEDNPSGEAFAWLDIRDPLRDSQVFGGWMVASSPALNALDHARYDVWVIRCTTA